MYFPPVNYKKRVDLQDLANQYCYPVCSTKILKTMKTLQKLITVNLKAFGWMVGLLLIVLFLHSCGPVYVTDRTVVRHEVAPPQWAPVYDNVQDVHYYYLPDIEVYYDVWRNEYVYMNQGTWIYSSYMPSYYSSYNINDAFVVVLDRGAYEPWRRHQNYVTQYPRNYYQSRYTNSNDRNNNGRMRGYNENAKRVIYHSNQNSGNGRSENVVRNPNTTNSRQPSQPLHPPKCKPGNVSSNNPINVASETKSETCETFSPALIANPFPQPPIRNPQSAISNQQSAISNQQSAILS